MTAKEKAEELFGKYATYVVMWAGDVNTTHQNCKQCALIAVDEILENCPSYPSDVDWDDVGGTHEYYYEAQRDQATMFWNEVKQEIEKL